MVLCVRIFGGGLFVWVAIGLMAVAGCGNDGKDAAVTANTNGPSYLALGDSYTIGESVEEAERFPNQLAGLAKWAKPLIIARTGWTTSELSAGIDAAQQAGELRADGYDRVTLLIGVNNQYRGGPTAVDLAKSVEVFRPELKALVKRAVGFARGDQRHVVIVSIPDWGVMPFGKASGRPDISAQIDAFNEVCHAEARAAGVGFVDVTAISRKALDQPELVAGDGLHPSGEQYRLWAEALVHSDAAMPTAATQPGK